MADDTPKKKSQVVYLVGAQRGGEHGQKRVVSPELAAELVENGHARYPDNYQGS